MTLVGKFNNEKEQASISNFDLHRGSSSSQPSTVANAECRKTDIPFINRVIHILIYHFMRDKSICFPSVSTSPAEAPF